MSDSLPVSVQLRLEDVCARFEAAWRSAGADGDPPRFEDYLMGSEGPERAALQRELVRVDLHYRRQGDPAAVTTVELSAATPVEPVDGPASFPHVPGYQILEEIDHGGMGVVYKARQVSLRRLVALKMVLSNKRASPEVQARFRREAEAVAGLQHPNIVQVYEVGEHGGRLFYSLEYVAGGTLADSLGAGLSDPKAAAVLVEKLARTMDAVHQCKVVHRDLKPANVLLSLIRDPEGSASEALPSGSRLNGAVPKITDFGLAKSLDDDAGQTQPGAVMGTPSYMAPEQARGETAHVTPLADVYALGAILYECLTGRPPFKASTLHETLRQVREEEPLPPRTLNPATPRDLETVCLKCLQKDPGRRYARAADLADDLGRWLKGEPVRARPVGRAGRLVKWGRRNPMAVALLAALLAGITVSTTSALIAVANGRKAKDSADKLQTANDDLVKIDQAVERKGRELEEALGRSLRGTLGWQETSSATGSEIDTFWDLAHNRGERVWYHFVADATRTPLGTRQLRRRREMALHAAAGLDLARREELERLLVDRLRGSEAGTEQHTDLALLIAALGDLPPETNALVGVALARAVANPPDGVPYPPAQAAALEEALSSMAPRLGPHDAATVAEPLIELLTGKVARGGSWVSAAKGLEALAPVLASPDVARAAWAVGPVLAKMESQRDLVLVMPMSRAFAALASRLGPEDASRLADTFTEAIDKKRGPNENFATLNSNALGLSAVAPRLEPRDAARVADALLKRMDSAASEVSLSRPDDLLDLALGLSSVTARLEPKEATPRALRAVGILTRAVRRGHDTRYLNPVLAGWSAAAAYLPPDDVVRAAEELASATKENAQNNVSPNKGGTTVALVSFFQSVETVLGRLDRGAAARLAKTVAPDICEAFTTAGRKWGSAEVGDDYFRAAEAAWLAEAVPVLARRLEPVDAAPLADAAAQALTYAMSKVILPPKNVARGPDEVGWLARRVVAVAPWLNRRDATRTAEALAGVMARLDQPYPEIVSEVARALAAVAARLEPGSPHLSPGAQIVVRAMVKCRLAELGGPNLGGDDPRIMDLVAALVTLAAGMSPAEVDQLSNDLRRRMEGTADCAVLALFAEAVVALTERRRPGLSGRAADAACVLARAAGRADYDSATIAVASRLAALASHLDPEDANRVWAEASPLLLRYLAGKHLASVDLPVAEALARIALRLRPAGDEVPAGFAGRAVTDFVQFCEGEESRSAARMFAFRGGMGDVPGGEPSQQATLLEARALEKHLPWMAAAFGPGNANQLVELITRLMAESGGPEDTTDPTDRVGVPGGITPRATDFGLEVYFRSNPFPDAPYARRELAGRLSDVLAGAVKPEALSRAGHLASMPGRPAGADGPGHALPVKPPAVTPRPCPFSTAELVEWLKFPTCVGAARRVILDRLGQRYSRRFADQWEFVRFAREQRLDVDLTGPPKRPESVPLVLDLPAHLPTEKPRRDAIPPEDEAPAPPPVRLEMPVEEKPNPNKMPQQPGGGGRDILDPPKEMRPRSKPAGR